jgi:hypothetical protein
LLSQDPSNTVAPKQVAAIPNIRTAGLATIQQTPLHARIQKKVIETRIGSKTLLAPATG